MKKSADRFFEKCLYPGLWRRKIATRWFRKYGGRFYAYFAFPKSASTYLVAMMATVFGNRLKIVRAKTGPGMGHSFISEEKLVRDLNYRKNILLYGHSPCTAENIKILKRLTESPKIIITVRPLADTIISYKEHVDKIGHGPLDYHVYDLPEGHPEWHALDDRTKYGYILQFVVPWYVSFAIGWMEAAKKIPVEFITFEEHTLFPEECLADIGRFFGMAPDDEVMDRLAGLDRKKANLNKGIRGRGYTLLTQEQLDRLNEMVSLTGGRFLNSFLGKYLLYGYDGLPVKPGEFMEMKRRADFSFTGLDAAVNGRS